MSIARSGVFTWTAPRTVVPVAADLRQHRVEIRLAVLRDESRSHPARSRLRRGRRRSRRGAFGGSTTDRPQRAAGIETGAHRVGERRRAGERCRALQCPVAADELLPVAGPVGLAPGKIGERDARSERRIPWIAREHRAGVGIDLGRHERRGGTARRTEHPFDISGHRQVPHAARCVAQRQARDLDRIAERNVLQQFGGDAVRGMLEPAVAPAVPRHIGGGVVADRQRRRTPQVAGIVVAQIEHLARAIADRIVRPRRELVLAAVDRPGEAAAFGRHLKAEGGIGDDIDPGRRRGLARAEDRHIFPPVFGEAAKPVEELERPAAHAGCAATLQSPVFG